MEYTLPLHHFPLNTFYKRNNLITYSKKWGVKRLEMALNLLHEVGLTLRSSKPLPQQEIVDRTLIKISMMISR